ncbi:hypothetical protein GUA46_14000 [Muricauda sp. HICW]|uniref:Aerotolerance regulator N-terminal domain-containing protein n=1 Tax=Flagellimonas chongwuensis TaxID=2697365 RepID=A0A850NMG7_9FLAO|nr:hypothetical protein [Allomuricauda chongwuensis]NVN19458.1 hypothetical protein [Allomuricauda chongwuensis]
MNDGVVFLNQNLFWPVIIVGLVLMAVFVWKEWSQRKERRFYVKLIASFLAIVSLCMIILKPSTYQDSMRGKGIVLTDGYRSSQLDSLKSIYKRIKTEEYTKGRTLFLLTEVDSIFLLGHGMEPFDFWQVEHKSVAFLGGDANQGGQDISNKSELILGEPLELSATYANPVAGNWAVLADNGGNPLDSIPLEETESQLIQLSAEPKASGQFVYHLMEQDQDGQVVSNEPIPIQVKEGRPLKILMVNTFPTFETKYLKNFLTEKGHEVLARTQLTKGKYKFEYFNGASGTIYGFTSENLKDYDLLIIDTDSYTGLGRTSKEAMEEISASEGLGIFIQADEGLFRLSESQSPFRFNKDYVTEIALGQPMQTLPKYPYAFQENLRTQEILLDYVTVASYIPVQKGKVGTTLLQNTYQLLLDGQEALYTRIWTKILNNITRKQETVLEWKSLTQIPRLDEPFEFELQTLLTDVEITTEEGARIPLLQDILIPGKFTGTVYPRKTGWNQLQVANDSISPWFYFVYDDGQLQNIHQTQLRNANYQKFGSSSTFDDSKSVSKKELQTITPIWLYFILLLSLGWLWLEPKLSS